MSGLSLSDGTSLSRVRSARAAATSTSSGGRPDTAPLSRASWGRPSLRSLLARPMAVRIAPAPPLGSIPLTTSLLRRVPPRRRGEGGSLRGGGHSRRTWRSPWSSGSGSTSPTPRSPGYSPVGRVAPEGEPVVDRRGSSSARSHSPATSLSSATWSAMKTGPECTSAGPSPTKRRWRARRRAPLSPRAAREESQSSFWVLVRGGLDRAQAAARIVAFLTYHYAIYLAALVVFGSLLSLRP